MHEREVRQPEIPLLDGLPTRSVHQGGIIYLDGGIAHNLIV